MQRRIIGFHKKKSSALRVHCHIQCSYFMLKLLVFCLRRMNEVIVRLRHLIVRVKFPFVSSLSNQKFSHSRAERKKTQLLSQRFLSDFKLKISFNFKLPFISSIVDISVSRRQSHKHRRINT